MASVSKNHLVSAFVVVALLVLCTQVESCRRNRTEVALGKLQALLNRYPELLTQISTPAPPANNGAVTQAPTPAPNKDETGKKSSDERPETSNKDTTEKKNNEGSPETSNREENRQE